MYGATTTTRNASMPKICMPFPHLCEVSFRQPHQNMWYQADGRTVQMRGVSCCINKLSHWTLHLQTPRHQNITNMSGYVCLECNFAFSFIKDFNTHLASGRHKDRIEEEEKCRKMEQYSFAKNNVTYNN